ncbi:transferase [Syncephalis pseudoplumigaleata]|uniref:Transferase n=1 Tax=Syncephalis pseudoplumigaleata TaxID=1712513 RepID=A0A4P9YYC7_9FUNG|nr:transferase [Syncephalis pseudoplumigaleata]|eukprot:RKP24562.1 transferase [Syncephalis pseudoplumigaleata]
MTVSSNETWIVPGAGCVQQTYQLSHADYFAGATYPCRIFFYKNHASKPDFLPTERLVAGLKTVLEHYPILYGRLALRDDGEYEVRPSTEGIPFIEAAAEEDFAAFEPGCPQHRITPDFQAVDQPYSEDMPLLIARVMRFAHNSGAAICVSYHHYIIDGHACVMLVKNWAAIVRGESRLPFPPGNDRRLLRLDPKPSEEEQQQLFRQLQKQHHADRQPRKDCAYKWAIVQFTSDRLQALKTDAIASLDDAEQDTRWFSTNDAVAMLVWRATVRARAIAKDQPLTLRAPIDMRSNYPDLPRNYAGNAIHLAVTTFAVGDLVGSPLGRVAAAHRQAIHASRAHTMEQWLMQGNIASRTPMAERLPNWVQFSDTIISDWSKFGHYTIDFGEGRPAYCRLPASRFRRVACILDMPPASDGSPTGLEVCLCMDETAYGRFCHDTELLTYGRVIG